MYDETIMFTDQNKIASYVLPFVLYLFQNEVIGSIDGRFAPKELCTREQAVISTIRLYETLGGTAP